ncbi:MAG: TonB-dependent receptor plug domain-containing protein [Ferruginibacter sp.]|nr:TonB-dependent receptor plug domain-containing protein [Ferruginibacter sp.]
MKYVMTILALGILCAKAQNKDKNFNDTTYLQPVEVAAIRAADKSPFAKTNLNKETIEKNNLGQDLPFLLNQVPSVVINSDAGNGVGYTGIRVRGTDASRINVTLNGIPYNDAESQGTFFVDLPDFASSVNSIQVQRGVGTSSNGVGAFGASVNLSTNELNKTKYAEINNSYGSFNTLKNTVKFGSGILGKYFTIDGRVSNIKSDGYIDRATSDLTSAYFSGAFTNAKTSLRLNIFTGKEKTYQAWNGVAEAFLKTNRTYNPSGTERIGTPYENETDNYTQTHYQLFYNQKLNSYWTSNVAIFLTKGKGYYEQYKADRELSSFGLPNYNNGSTTITNTDIVRQLWLDNDFYGSIFSAQYKKNKTQLTLGGGYTKYDGQHFGEIIWAATQAAVPKNYRWYDLPATKKDVNFYSKWTQQINNYWQSFVDIQYRNVNYNINGFRDNPTLKIGAKYNFLNPKIGVTYNRNSWQWYVSYARAAKEPNRDDFEAGLAQQPKAEYLNDFEMGIERKKPTYNYGATIYYMQYKNQLVLTGKINDVGAYTRTNIPNSYRMGIELQGGYVITKKINIAANFTISDNKVKNFTEFIDDYDNGAQQTKLYNKSTIAFSPSMVAGSTIAITPFKNATINLLSKYVGKQYMDNTANNARSLKAFFVQDVNLNYSLQGKVLKNTQFIVQLNNVFNKKYEPNGYTFSYIYGGAITTENFYFPMAGFNVMVGVNVRL